MAVSELIESSLLSLVAFCAFLCSVKVFDFPFLNNPQDQDWHYDYELAYFI